MVRKPAQSSFSDERLVAGCLEGDERSWQLLLQRYKALIYSVPIKAGLSEDEAADVFQNTCIALFKSLSRLRSVPHLSSWLTTTAARLSWAAKKARERVADGLAVEELPTAERFLTDRDLLTLEQQQLVRQAVERLPRRCRELVKALLLTSRPPSYREIARSLGVPVGSVGPTRARCLEKLRRVLMRMGYGT